MYKQFMMISVLALLMSACQNQRSSVRYATGPNRVAAPVKVERQPLSISIPDNDKDLVQLLIKQNTQLQSLGFMRDAAFSQIDASDQFPDTTIKVMPVGDFAETAAGEVQGAIGIEQMIPAIGILRNKRLIAEQKFSAQTASFEAMKIQLVRALRMQLALRQESLEILKIINENHKLLNSIKEVVLVRLANASAERSQLLEVEMMVSKLKLSEEHWRGQRLDSESRIRFLLGLPQSALFPANIILNQQSSGMQKERVLKIMQAQHPRLLKAMAEQKAAVFVEQLAGAQGRPGFMFGFQYTMIDDDGLSPMANGDDQWAVNIGLRIPLDRSAVRARQSAASLKYQKQLWRTRATREELEQELISAWDLYESARERWVLSKSEIIPKSQERFELLESGYQTGRSSYIDVMDAWRQVLEAGIQERRLFFSKLRKQYHLMSHVGLIFWSDAGGNTNE